MCVCVFARACICAGDVKSERLATKADKSGDVLGQAQLLVAMMAYTALTHCLVCKP